MPRYYFDYNATTPVDERVLNAMQPFWRERFGNPSSSHQEGQICARALRQSRQALAAFLGASSESQILFTSGGTESNNAAIHSALKASPGKKHLVTSRVEHSSVKNIFKRLEAEGYRVSWIGVDGDGRLDLAGLEASLTSDTALVSLMAANNETGVLFPVERAAEIIKNAGVLFHVDAVQSAGKIPLNFKSIPVDFAAVSAHKFYGPKGIGALYIRKPEAFHPLISGGSQERGRRGGTENLPGIAGMACAAELVQAALPEESRRVQALRDFFESEVIRQIPDAVIHGFLAERLPNTTSLRFKGVDGEALLFSLDERGIAASSGSACMSGAREPSHVLQAMGVPDDEAGSAIRFSFGAQTDREEILKLLGELSSLIHFLRNQSPQKNTSLQEVL